MEYQCSVISQQPTNSIVHCTSSIRSPVDRNRAMLAYKFYIRLVFPCLGEADQCVDQHEQQSKNKIKIIAGTNL